MRTEFTIDDLKRTVERIADVRARHLDLLLAAFLQETGKKPSECVLVEEVVKDGVRWYFRVRDSD
jgi:rubrerythrin